MNIMDYIPFGHENGVTRRQLAAAVGSDDRGIREMIAKARRKYVICNMQDGKGYFRPAENEAYMVKRFLRQERHRKKQIEAAFPAAEKWLEENGR